MIVIDFMGGTAYQKKPHPARDDGNWRDGHMITAWAGFNGNVGEMEGNVPSSYLADTGPDGYGAEKGDAFTKAEYVSPDFEQWSINVDECPHADGSPNAIYNYEQTSRDTTPQIEGVYTHWNFCPGLDPLKPYMEGNDCFANEFWPAADYKYAYALGAAYMNWRGYFDDPQSDPPSLMSNLGRIQSRMRETAKHISEPPRFVVTSLHYVATGQEPEPPAGTDACIPIDNDEFRQIAAHTFHEANGIALWYQLSSQANGDYVTPWVRADIQANVNIMHEEYRKLWTNSVVGSIPA